MRNTKCNIKKKITKFQIKIVNFQMKEKVCCVMMAFLSNFVVSEFESETSEFKRELLNKC